MCKIYKYSFCKSSVRKEIKFSVRKCWFCFIWYCFFFYHFHIYFSLSIKRETIHMSYKIYLLFHFIYLFYLEGVFASVKSLWYLQVYGVCMCNICKCSVSQSLVRKEIMRRVRKCWACCSWFFFLSLTHTRILFFLCVYKKEIIDR